MLTKQPDHCRARDGRSGRGKKGNLHICIYSKIKRSGFHSCLVFLRLVFLKRQFQLFCVVCLTLLLKQNFRPHLYKNCCADLVPGHARWYDFFLILSGILLKGSNSSMSHDMNTTSSEHQMDYFYSDKTKNNCISCLP